MTKSFKNPLENLDILTKESFLVRDFFRRYGAELQLSIHTSDEYLNVEMVEPTIHRPGLAMTGYTEVFTHQRMQILGRTEYSYLVSRTHKERQDLFHKLKPFKSPCWVLTNGVEVLPEIIEYCSDLKIPLFSTSMSTVDYIGSVTRILDEWFAPYSPVHASLVDVYGVGMLYVGSSNIGKSECVLDLVERGHRLVADDMVKIVKIGDSIIGKSNHIISHHMEIRGVGIIDIKSMFGIHAVRKTKKVEIVVELQYWNKDSDYDRTGLVDQHIEIMGVKVPKVVIPVSPGKNITVISEVVAMNALMKFNGQDTAAEFNRKLIEIIQDRSKRRESELNFDTRALKSDIYE